METESKNKTFRVSPFAIFEETRAKLNLSGSQLCRELGYAENTHSGWKTSGGMPYVAALACRALLAEKSTLKQQLILVRTNNKISAEAITSMCVALGCDYSSIG